MTSLKKTEQALAWDLRGAWVKGERVRVTLTERAMIRTIVGRVSRVAVTGAFAEVDGWHVAMCDVLAIGKTKVALSRAEVPLRGGLPDPDRQVRALVTGIFQNEKTAAERDDSGSPLKVTGWKTTVNLRIEYVEHVPDTDEGLIEQRFKAMAEVDPGAAGRLVERLQALMTEQLTVV